jgi:hypothetical protein
MNEGNEEGYWLSSVEKSREGTKRCAREKVGENKREGVGEKTKRRILPLLIHFVCNFFFFFCSQLQSVGKTRQQRAALVQKGIVFKQWVHSLTTYVAINRTLGEQR